jgi:hypothetical protein
MGVLLGDNVVQMELGFVPLKPMDHFGLADVGRVLTDPIEDQLN